MSLLIGPAAPRAWPPGRRRAHAQGVGTYLAAAAIHFGLLLSFAAAGAWPLVWFNIGSIAAWIVVGVLHRKHHTQLAVVLGLTEGVAHAVFATVVIGWESGFHFAIPVVAGAYFGFSSSRQALIPIAAVCVWVAMLLVLHDHTPWVQLSASVLTAYTLGTGVAAFVIVAMIVVVLAKAADRAEAAVVREHERSERLLQNMLPAEIAHRLKDGHIEIADRVDEASVLFADLVGFTTISAAVKPGELVEMLGDVFSRFDALAEQHQLEKIKTIGDAYMVASGVPRARADHAAALARFGLELIAIVDALPPIHGVKLRMRVGMSSGVVVAGVIGRTKPAYDLWGDTVNTAARMESHGEPGRIHVTQEVRDRLGDAFAVEPRGMIDVKGKGAMETYFLTQA